MALPEPKRIELLPAKEPFLAKVQVVKSIPVLAPGIALLIFLGIALYMNGQVNTIQKEIDTKRAKMANLDVLQAKLKTLKEKDIQTQREAFSIPILNDCLRPLSRHIERSQSNCAGQYHLDTSLGSKQRKTSTKGDSIHKAPGRRIPKGRR